MTQDRTLKFNLPRLFSPSIRRGVQDSGTPTGLITSNEVSGRNFGTTSSFRYDPPGAALRSTQQIHLDWSRFENHTFFNSARVKVHLAFDEIINRYPFDGTQLEIEEFLDGLTGYEKYIYNSFPKNKGYLIFSGSADGVSGTYIPVKDFAGTEFPTVSRNTTGENILDPGLDSMTWEMQIFLSENTNDNQTICQKVSGTLNGIGLFVSESASTAEANLIFLATSGSSVLQTSATLDKGRFNHIAATFNRKPGTNKLQLYVNEALANETGNSIDFGTIDFLTSPFNIGSGSTQLGSGNTDFVPRETLSGALDEFRFFHDIRTLEQQKRFSKKAIHPSDSLVLYFKFNEPSGSFGTTDTNRVVLDYSGNSLHSRISENGFNLNLRNTGSVGNPQNPMTYENVNLSPILFPNFQGIIDLNVDLVSSATLYDNSNPNLITKLVPQHYFLQGQSEEALETEDGTLVDAYTGDSLPGTGDQGQAQLLQEFLFVFAKFFDEQKIFLDSFSKVLNVSYDGIDSTPDQLLSKVAEYYGLSLPNLFSGATVEQFIDAENLTIDFSTGEQALKIIQNKIWRRILANVLDIIQSKGTLHSVKSFIRAIGIDPDQNFKIREFGGPTKRNISNQRENRVEVAAMLDMSASNSFVITPYLSSSRVETGYPEIAGTFVNKSEYPVHGISDEPNDGLLTSGSFTFEGIYKFPRRDIEYISDQSLARFVVTGSDTNNFVGKTAPIANLLATSGSTTDIHLYIAPTSGSQANSIELYLSGVNVFDGNKWNLSFGRVRNDDVNIVSSSLVSSSYFLRAARSSNDKIIEQYVTESFFVEEANADFSYVAWQSVDSTNNASGTAIEIGYSEYNSGTAGTELYLNNSNLFPNDRFLSTDLEGKVSQVRFWSQALTVKEWNEHVLNFKNVGVSNPKVSFNFDTQQTGSFERLRADLSMDQMVTGTDGSGNIEIFDFSRNNFHSTGMGFEASALVVKPETFFYSFISPNFDESTTTNKVRARGYQNFELSQERGAIFGVVSEIEPNDQPQDDLRFTIEFSIIDALNQDIINIFSTLEEFDNALGDPQLAFSPDYPDLESLRDIYFQRLEDKVNLKSFFEFFKWFDNNISIFIEALIPRKTKFRGVNFVIEPHMLERSKWENLNVDQYLNSSQRSSDQGTILLQQLVGEIKKY